eukprot:12921239-Prorocentrum_lima.AAC.1
MTKIALAMSERAELLVASASEEKSAQLTFEAMRRANTPRLQLVTNHRHRSNQGIKLNTRPPKRRSL